jgi:ABC-type glycerol-3-phosphate transport system substrate-binding protein
MKRAGIDKIDFTLATEITPQFDSDKKKQVNLARYWYFGISKNTKNPYHAAKFLTFLTSPEA